jgi:hypothetical protein
MRSKINYKILLVGTILLFSHLSGYAQSNKTDSLINIAIQRLDNLEKSTLKDTITNNISTLNPNSSTGISIEKNMPWIVAFIIGLLTVAINWIMSYYNRSTSIRIAQEQILNSNSLALTQFKANLNSKNRQEWINDFREALSQFLSQCALLCMEYSSRNDQDQEKTIVYFEKIVFFKSKIIMLLNESKPEQRIIREDLDKLLPVAFTSSGDFNLKDYTEIEKRLYFNAQKLFGIHWKKIKDLEK